jgi:hypothetical protein
VTAGPSLRRAKGSILGPEQPAGTAAVAAVARTEGREMRRGLVWPGRPVDAAV